MDLEVMKDRFKRCNDLFLNELTTEEKISGLFDRSDRSEYERGSILVPFVIDHDEPHLLFTIRNQSIAMYPGEISFPGGRSEDIDSSTVETALREASEEINLTPENVKIIGSFDDACVISRETNNRRKRVYVLSIVIGLINDITNLIANKDEVDEIFLFPLKDLFSNLRMMPYKLPKFGEKRLPTILVEKEGRRAVSILGFSATIAILVCSILNLVPMGSRRKVQEVLEERINTFRNSPGFNWLLNFAMRECGGQLEDKAVKPKL